VQCSAVQCSASSRCGAGLELRRKWIQTAWDQTHLRRTVAGTIQTVAGTIHTVAGTIQTVAGRTINMFPELFTTCQNIELLKWALQ
jgi:hypothetical protein